MSQARHTIKLGGLALAISMVVAGCSTSGTIANLDSEVLESEASLNFENLDHEQVRNEYDQLLELVDDAYIKEQISRRIAGVHMQEGDDKQTKKGVAPKSGYYREAIESYLDILEKYPNSPDNAEVLYQLAKAYDMEGQSNNARQMLERLINRHPYYTAISEAYFRLGDIYFGRGWYEKAEDAYRETTLNDGGKLNLNAHYMLAWSQYKQGAYGDALHHYGFVLNELLSAQMNGRKLNNIEKPLVDDTLHSMSLALVQLGGAQAIQDIKVIKRKPYIWRLYQQLGEFYLEKARYDDSAASYREFVKQYPMDKRASEFYSKLIAAYTKGGFPKLVLAEKEKYVDLYQPASRYLFLHASQKQATFKHLKAYYVELASHYHSQGQQAAKKAKTDKEAHLAKLASSSFSKATDYYGRFIEHFSSDQRVAGLLYKKADAHFANEEFDQAARDYSQVAYQYKGFKQASEAAYASILAYQKHIDVLVANDKDVSEWRAKSVDAMLTFAKVFHKDKRATPVLTNAAQALFKLQDFDRAISVASDLISKTKRLNNQLKKTAYGIIAHSYFQKGQYQLAKNNYLKQRSLVKQDDAEYGEISNQVAASVYKKAEQLRSRNYQNEAQQMQAKQLALKELLSLKKLAPHSNIRVLAQYDAISILLEDKNWKRAINELKQMAKLFPQHELAPEFPRKLAFAYEQSQQWKLAASAYTQLWYQDKDPKVKQEALFIAAGLQAKIGQTKKAIEFYRDYAHKYEQPFDNRMEARYQLAELYKQQKDNSRHLFWLRRIIDGDQKGGEQRTERSRYLGAWANSQYGDYFAWEFKRRKMRLPLETSMAKKNQYLQDATTRYEMAAQYGILEFVSQSNFKMAELYQIFSNELDSAPLPNGLSAQDKAMYQQILSEQAAPFKELAASIYYNNVSLSWDGHFNGWIEKSYDAMKALNPARFNKEEVAASYGDEIR